uniref:Uncharacterized protein n=1 Tax=uncultured delta proteobacterium HF0200_19J16 TaxID=710831 RepID=E0XUB8_9DELT|nr:hypothetical protein [uncultured delta proteobacterium HF0200_19J16]
MHEKSLKSYSQKDLSILLERGVHIPDLNLVHITKDVQLDNIASGSSIYPFVRITGSKTQIHSGARIGVRGPVILENSFIGENAVIGDLGQVTLIDTVVGAKSVLGTGVAEQAVFLGKESMVIDFTTGYGFRVRKGSLYEEDASSAQHTDTKMTILFPWATLGSDINFCDALLAGGTGLELGSFSEVGSGTIHFNYSIRGDKATASLFGDVLQGVFLDQKRLFIGGNNSLLGPVKADFGAMTAAGARIKGKLPKGLNYGHSLPKGTVDYDARIFSGVSGIVNNQVNVLAELTALANWYKQVRINCVAQTPEQKFLYESGLRMVELNYQERLDQLRRYVDFLENSVRLLERMQASKKEISEQKDLLSRWPKLGSEFKNLEKYETQIPDSLKEELENLQSQGKSDYTGLIKNLSQSGKQVGKTWLSEIAEVVRNVYTAGMNYSG